MVACVAGVTHVQRGGSEGTVEEKLRREVLFLSPTRMKTLYATRKCDNLPDVFVDAEIPSRGVTNDLPVIRFSDQG